MDIPMITSPEGLKAYSNNVTSRRWYMEPLHVGFVSVQLGDHGVLISPKVHHISALENFSYAGALAGIAHHRSGNALYPLGHEEVSNLEQLFQFSASEQQVEMVREVCQLAKSTKVYMVFVGPCHEDWNESPITGTKRSIFDLFLQHVEHHMRNVH
jgi:hypothetical protein